MKNIITICFLMLIGTLTAQVPTTGLISHWPFSGNANDIIGGNNGTVYNAILTTDRFGNPNCAYRFNGFSSYILMANAGPKDSAARSVSFWVKTSYTPLNVKTVFGYGANPGNFALQINYGCAGIGVDKGNAQYIRQYANVSNGVWHHYVAVFNPAVSTKMSNINFYVDGSPVTVLACATTGTALSVNTSTTFPITIGRVSDAFSRYVDGDMDDFFLYNRALTPTEVLALYNDTPCLATPPAPGAISGSITACQGATVVYSVAPVAGATSYTWTLPGGWTGTSTTNTILATVGANSGQVTVASGNCCGSSQPATQDVTINPAPALSITATQFTVCNGNSTTLYGNGASTYTWNSFLVTPSLNISPSSSTTFTLSGTNSFGCSSTTVANVVVTNNTLPTILLNGSGISCPGQTVNIAANGASTYTWQPGALNGFFVSVSPTVTTVYTVTGTDANGCYNSATYTQTVSTCAGIQQQTVANSQIEIFPNPNSGNFTVDVNVVTDKTYLKIYNSIGQLVLDKKLQTKQTLINEKLPTGTYFIKIIDQDILKGLQKIIVQAE